MKEIEEKWSRTSSIYNNRTLTEAQTDIWNLLSHIKELEKRIELAEATREDALAYAKMYKDKTKELKEGIDSLFLLIDNANPEAWANGNEIGGSDEGICLASRMIDELRNKLIEKEKAI